MANTKKEEWVSSFSDAINGASPQNTVAPGGEQPSQPDKYAGLKNVSYKEMLDSKIQAAAVKEQAQKYVGTAMGAVGMSGQGLSESAKTGIFGTYQRAINEADKVHQQNLIDIENQRANDLEIQQKDRWQSAMEMMQQAQNKEELDKIKADFYDGFNEDQKNYFDFYYASIGNSIGKAGEYATIDSLKNATIVGSNGKPLSLGAQFQEETEIAFIHANQGDLQVGSVVCLDNTAKKSGGAKGYIMWTGTGFKVVSENEFNSAQSKFEAKWISGEKSEWNKI